MIALVSSTIFPGTAPLYGASRSLLPEHERLAQTRNTVDSLLRHGYAEIYLADNSGPRWVAGTDDVLAPARVLRFNHHQFRNKGIAELYMLLESIDALPAATPILKISGRYVATGRVADGLGAADVAAKLDARGVTVSTRCYMVRDREVYRRFLQDTLDALYGDATRIRGPRSLVRIVRNSLFPGRDTASYFDPPVSIEWAAARALTTGRYRVNWLTDLAIDGEIAISRERIRE